MCIVFELRAFRRWVMLGTSSGTSCWWPAIGMKRPFEVTVELAQMNKSGALVTLSPMSSPPNRLRLLQLPPRHVARTSPNPLCPRLYGRLHNIPSWTGNMPYISPLSWTQATFYLLDFWQTLLLITVLTNSTSITIDQQPLLFRTGSEKQVLCGCQCDLSQLWRCFWLGAAYWRNY